MAQSRHITKYFAQIIESNEAGLGTSVEGNIIRDVADPIVTSDAATRGFVERAIDAAVSGSFVQAGRGLLLTDRTLSVSVEQPHIITVGTLQGLNVNGNVNFTGSDIHVTAPDPAQPSDVAVKRYVDAMEALPGVGLEKTGQTLSISSTLPSVTAVGELTALKVVGDATFNGHVTVPAPTINSDAATKLYVDSCVVQPGVGVTKTGNVISIQPSQRTVTELGSLTDLTVLGATVLQGPVTIPQPIAPEHAATRSYVDSKETTVGTGLAKNGTVVSVLPSQNHVTSVGSLSSLTVAGNASFAGTLSSTNATSAIAEDTTSWDTGAIVTKGGLCASGMSKLRNVCVTGKTIFKYDYLEPFEDQTIIASTSGMILNPPALLQRLTISFPTNPTHGQMVNICSSRTIATVSTINAIFAANNALVTISAGVPIRYIFCGFTSEWYRT